MNAINIHRNPPTKSFKKSQNKIKVIIKKKRYTSFPVATHAQILFSFACIQRVGQKTNAILTEVLHPKMILCFLLDVSYVGLTKYMRAVLVIPAVGTDIYPIINKNKII